MKSTALACLRKCVKGGFMRKVNEIIIHCSATKPNIHIGAKEIDSWHRKRGFDEIGYHYVIRRSGEIEKGRDLDKAGAHCKKHNSFSIGICLVGGIDDNGKSENNFTESQFQALRKLVAELKILYPKASLHGHNEFAAKDCPCFNVQEFFQGER